MTMNGRAARIARSDRMSGHSTPHSAAAWRGTPLARVLGPITAFMEGSTSGGLVLLGAAVLALVWANSPWAATYDAILHTYLTVSVGPFSLSYDLLHWINDGLMAIFFFLVGLEIKREILVGELADRRAALLPIVAAVGGAVVPAIIYATLNQGGSGARGWGVPMATDIAFALGILALVGDRVPFGLRVFLTAVAIVDDLLAVLVIAIFYSGGINLMALGVGLIGLVVLAALNVLGVRALLVYALLGIVVWAAFLQSGVHATVAGVLVALTVPARRVINAPTFLARANALLAGFQAEAGRPDARMLTDQQQQDVVLELENTCEQVLAPLQKAEHGLHTWVAFFIMPVFALANAGVALSPAGLQGSGLMVALGILAGLLIGKPVGLLGVTWLAMRLGLVSLPTGVNWGHMAGVGFLAGIGFTMSLFIATLGFGQGDLLAAAKVGIFAASAVAGALGFILVRRSTAAVAEARPTT
jgi:Na+:H+ antiporter, NhaA family